MGGAIDNTLGTNLFGDNSGDKAAIAQQKALGDANRMAKNTYDQTQGELSPYKEVGIRGLVGMQAGDLHKNFGAEDFQKDPGYDFRMSEGMKALERSAAARGGLNSGATLKALTKYGQDFAANEYQNAYNRFSNDASNRFNRMSQLAGMGQNAQNVSAQLGQNYSQYAGNNLIGQGNASAANEISKGNKQASAVSAGAGLLFSDERLKTDVTPVSKEDLTEMKKHLKAYTFKYINESYGKGEMVGVMAQDLEKSKLGRTLVVEDANGHKQIDLTKVMSLFLATMAEG
jgi:hypothetical protein